MSNEYDFYGDCVSVWCEFEGGADFLSRLLVGSRVTRLEGYREEARGDEGLVLTLDSGVRVLVLGTGDCCAWWEVSLEDHGLVGSVVESVSCTGKTLGEDGYERYAVTLTGEAGRLAVLRVVGTEGDGCYDLDAVEIRALG